jgi:putative oxidoreductase
MSIGSALVRGVVGPLFIGHGTQKLFGWFGGYGLEGTGGYFESLGLTPGRRHATAAGIAETLGGALVTLGALTPVGATLISGTMVTAIRKAHANNGPWVTNGGYEYNLVIVAAMAALAEHGPGAASVDDALFPELKGPAMAALTVGAAIAGSFVGTSERFNPAGPAPLEGSIDVAGDPATIDDPVPTTGT